jgi:hypothetical protein
MQSKLVSNEGPQIFVDVPIFVNVREPSRTRSGSFEWLVLYDVLFNPIKLIIYNYFQKRFKNSIFILFDYRISNSGFYILHEHIQFSK